MRALRRLVAIVGLAAAGACGTLVGVQSDTSSDTDGGSDADVDDGDPPPDGGADVAALPDGAKIVFVTTNPFEGDKIGGFAGANEKCQDLAIDAGIPQSRTFYAFLKGSSALPDAGTEGPYYLLSGDEVFDHRPPFDGTVSPPHALDVDPYSRISEAGIAWTGAGGFDCQNWTASGSGSTGSPQARDPTWVMKGSYPCATGSHRLYCFEK